MNEYFCSVGKDLAEEIEYAPNPQLSRDYNVNREEKCFTVKTIDVRNIRDGSDKITTSNGFDTEISSYFLKLAMPYIENPLAYIFNTSLERRKFCYDWKTARETPVVKKVTNLINRITTVYQFYQLYLDCLRNLYLINCTNILTTMVYLVLVSLVLDVYIPQ